MIVTDIIVNLNSDITSKTNFVGKVDNFPTKNRKLIGRQYSENDNSSCNTTHRNYFVHKITTNISSPLISKIPRFPETALKHPISNKNSSEIPCLETIEPDNHEKAHQAWKESENHRKR